ncbi:acyl-CoA carboxylase subunit epsilon [Nocardia sp. CDC153]|uniref:acyl-CoA carboxylase subunit epsilon n=1 Tax=Nocardia sp. CDC153 TaxID=3112167 RepID=UPI002DB97D08|nr:acyl-CoA carboxylase subunit epsilon [Nocardia sp. CDC153]MEC3952003.1 acyl-CoA carboxylase subunit epsilon [Nocardia sp. CDC153]
MQEQLPVIRIEHGEPTDTELAAVLLVLSRVMGGTPVTPPQCPAAVRWIHPERRIALIASHSWAAA